MEKSSGTLNVFVLRPKRSSYVSFPSHHLAKTGQGIKKALTN